MDSTNNTNSTDNQQQNHIVGTELTLGNSIKYSFSWVVDNIGVCVGVSLIPGAMFLVVVVITLIVFAGLGVQIISEDIMGETDGDLTLTAFIAMIVIPVCVHLLAWVGFMNVGLKMAQSGKVKFTDFFVSIGTYIKGVCITIVSTMLVLSPFGVAGILTWGFIEADINALVAVIVLTLAFVVATAMWLYLFARLGFALFLFLEKKQSFIDCFKNSWNLTSGHSLKLMGIDIIHFLIFQAINATFIGLLVAYPVYTGASAYAYKVLEQRATNTEKDIS